VPIAINMAEADRRLGHKKPGKHHQQWSDSRGRPALRDGAIELTSNSRIVVSMNVSPSRSVSPLAARQR
jgi:hypothetical protein